MTQNHEHPSPVMISGFLDGELSDAEAQVLERHAATCHTCAMRLVEGMRLKAATSSAESRYEASAEVLTRLRSGIVAANKRENPGARLRRGWSPLVWSTLTVCLVLVAFAAWQQVRRPDTLSAELLDAHLATLSNGADPEVISTDKHTVKPWFQGKLPFSFNVPDALPPDTQLKGADLTFVNGRPAALLLFLIHKHEVSVFVMSRDAGELMRQSGTRAGFSFQAETTPELRLVGVSDVNPVELGELMKALARVQ